MALNSFTSTYANAVLDAAGALLNGGTIELYTSGESTLLATITLGSPAFAAASSKSMSLNATTRDESADATGDVAVAVFKNSGGTVMFKGTVTDTGGAGDVTMPSVSVTIGEPVEITSGTLTHP